MGKKGGKSSIVTQARKQAAKPEKPTRKEQARQRHERKKTKRPGGR